MRKRDHAARLALRYLFFAIGISINSFGIAVITKASLGTSPISSPSYVLDLAFPPTLGEFSFLVNMLFILIQVILLRRDFQPIQFLQIAVNVLFSALIDVGMAVLSPYTPEGLPLCLATLLVGCAILALGMAVEVAPNVVLVPGEGVVRAISAVTERPFGSCKVVFDITLVAIAVTLSLILFGSIRGLGIGTVISALLVGRLVNLFNRRLPFLAKIAALSRSETGAPEAAL